MLTAEQNPPLATMSAEDYAKVRLQLERLLESHQFRNSRRYPALLRFLVEESLDGRGDLLKERLIGIHVFGRPADYDTAADPIVRVTIAEIRKRIAQYYHDEDHDAEIRIELITGRYAPEFRLRRESKHEEKPAESIVVPSSNGATSSVDSGSMPALDVSSRVSASSIARQEVVPVSRKHRTVTIYMWSSVLLLVLLVAGFYGIRWLRPTALDEFWTPILSPKRTVLLCLPNQVARKKTDAKANLKSSGKDDSGPSFLEHESLGENVVYSDILAMLNIVNVLMVHRTDYRVRLNVSTTLDDLRHGPSIMIGGLDNEWTLRAMDRLPFHFAGSDEAGFWIVDVKDPGNRRWSLDLKMPYATVTRDYALVARIHNQQTGQPEILVAGIGMSGTAAAGEMVGNEQLMQEVRRRVGAGFKDHDFEVVMSTDVVNGIAGSPKILAVSVW